MGFFDDIQHNSNWTNDQSTINTLYGVMRLNECTSYDDLISYIMDATYMKMYIKTFFKYVREYDNIPELNSHIMKDIIEYAKTADDSYSVMQTQFFANSYGYVLYPGYNLDPMYYVGIQPTLNKIMFGFGFNDIDSKVCLYDRDISYKENYNIPKIFDELKVSIYKYLGITGDMSFDKIKDEIDKKFDDSIVVDFSENIMNSVRVNVQNIDREVMYMSTKDIQNQFGFIRKLAHDDRIRYMCHFMHLHLYELVNPDYYICNMYIGYSYVDILAYIYKYKSQAFKEFLYILLDYFNLSLVEVIENFNKYIETDIADY